MGISQRKLWLSELAYTTFVPLLETPPYGTYFYQFIVRIVFESIASKHFCQNFMYNQSNSLISLPPSGRLS